jgi:hypothetical protein
VFIKLSFLFIGFFINCSVFSQSLNLKDIGELHSTVGLFLMSKEKMDERKRPSELILCILDVDNNGKVNCISLFADEKNRDSTYGYLRSMTPSAFGGLTFDKCKGKSIMFSIISTGQGKGPLYITGILEANPIKRVTVESETSKLVNISPCRYSAPYHEH